MANLSKLFACITGSLLACLISSYSAAETPADLIFLGNNIVTMDEALENATAVAIRDDRIVWVGQQEQADAWRGNNTKVRELGEHALLPGLIDAHGHVTFLAQTNQQANVASPPVGPVKNIADLQNVLRSYIADNAIADGEWLIGSGYDDSLIAEGRHPNRQDLDAVSTKHPIALIHVSAHLMAANSLALKKAGLNEKTPDPKGGHIRREADGKTPNGVLEETAIYKLRSQIAQPLTADMFKQALDVYAANGITTVQDGATSLAQIKSLQAFAATGAMTLDVVAYPVMNKPDQPLPADIKLGEYHNRFKVNGIKLVLDGSPQGKTAYLEKPYHVPPAGKDKQYRGYPIFPEPQVNALVKSFIERKIPMLAHANGDAAAELLINAVAAAKPDWDHRTVMIHAQTVREDQLDRMSQLNIVPSYFATHTFFWGDWHRDSVLGPERGMRISPTRSTVDRGMYFTVHNDAPIVPPDMIRLLWATTNRVTRSGKTLGEEQRLNVHEALKAITTNAAYQYFEEQHKGSISVDKLADLTILSANPLKMRPGDLLELSVVETISHGQSVYKAE